MIFSWLFPFGVVGHLDMASPHLIPSTYGEWKAKTLYFFSFLFFHRPLWKIEINEWWLVPSGGGNFRLKMEVMGNSGSLLGANKRTIRGKWHYWCRFLLRTSGEANEAHYAEEHDKAEGQKEGKEKEGSAPLVTGLALDLGSARCYCLRSVWESREVLEVRWDGIRERSTRKAIWIKLGHLPERKLHRFMYLVAVGTELSRLMLTSCHHILIWYDMICYHLFNKDLININILIIKN